MRAAVITRPGSPVASNVRYADDLPRPQPGPGQLLVRTEASALNHLDLFIGRGLPGLDLTWPWISGSDGCGMVESVGEGVASAWVGRRVLLNAAVRLPDPARPDTAAVLVPDLRMIGEHLPGTHAEFFVAPAVNVVDVGEADPVEAAAFALVHLTAWRMLVTRAGMKPGQTVLITGIGGGVALALLNICRHFGCATIVTSRQESKLDRAIQLGADHGVLDTGDDWSRQVRGLTGKRGCDIVADSIGKAVHNSCIKSLARGGVFVTCGATTGADAVTDLARLFWNQLTLAGSTMGNMDEFRQIVALHLRGAFRPVIDSVHKAPEAAKAFERLESGEQFGKVVVRW